MNASDLKIKILKHLDDDLDRIIIGIVGKPGSGKSTIALEIQRQLNSELVAIVPMDSFHMSNKILKAKNLLHCKGAPNTFDVEGFFQLLTRIREDDSHPIYYPIFHREIEESINGEGVISGDARVILVEGNYLLSKSEGWEKFQPIFDYIYFIQIPEKVRIQRLISRHVEFGKSLNEASEWALGSDEINAQFIEQTAHLADDVLELG